MNPLDLKLTIELKFENISRTLKCEQTITSVKQASLNSSKVLYMSLTRVLSSLFFLPTNARELKIIILSKADFDFAHISYLPIPTNSRSGQQIDRYRLKY